MKDGLQLQRVVTVDCPLKGAISRSEGSMIRSRSMSRTKETLEPDQYVVDRAGVEIILPCAAYESPGGEPGESFMCGAVGRFVLEPVTKVWRQAIYGGNAIFAL